VKRDHAGLCSYNPKQQTTAKPGSPLAAGVKRQRSPGSEGSLKKEENRWPRTNGETHYLNVWGHVCVISPYPAKTRGSQPHNPPHVEAP
jgi:hypothetical protein